MEETEKHEETEIHVGETLYNEIQAWVKKEIGAQETPAKRKEKKKTNVPHLENQPKLSQWFTKEGKEGQEDEKKEEKAANPEKMQF